MKPNSKKRLNCWGILIVCLSILIATFAIFVAITVHPPLAKSNIHSLLNSLNYTIENHTIQTEDGYLLGVQRIPCTRNTPSCDTKTRPPVFLMHGLSSSGMEWVIHHPNKALGLMLVEKGYDVWLGNNRGTRWSRKHVSLDPEKDKKFWDYSFHEIGKYDLPAVIDYILNTTGRKKINYVGISQGFTELLAMGSTRPEYNDKILMAVGLAPVTTFLNITIPFATAYVKLNPILEWLYDSFSQYKIDENWILFEILHRLVPNPSVRRILSENVLGLSDVDEESVLSMASNWPQTISVKQMSHYVQTANGKFAPYDYGNKEKNLEAYGEIYPSPYDLTKVTAPLFLFYSKCDQYINQDVLENVMNKLPNIKEKHLVEDDLFNHADFALHKKVDVLVNNDVIRLLDKINNKQRTESSTEK